MRDDTELAQIAEQAYLNLEFRQHQHGGAQRAAVPFVADGGLVYALVASEAGGTHWLQLAPRVRLAAATGRIWLDGRARLAWEVERERALDLLRRKYGAVAVFAVKVRAWLARRRVAVVAVHV